MDTELVTLQLPASLYEKLQALAIEKHTEPMNVIANLVTDATQQKNWLQDLNALRQQIKEDGGLQVGSTKEEVIDRLHSASRRNF